MTTKRRQQTASPKLHKCVNCSREFPGSQVVSRLSGIWCEGCDAQSPEMVQHTASQPQRDAEQAEIEVSRPSRIEAQGGPDGLDIGYEAGRQARESNPAAYYASPVERGDDNGCSCTPNNGPSCHNCR